jgi:hypothetical protein
LLELQLILTPSIVKNDYAIGVLGGFFLFYALLEVMAYALLEAMACLRSSAVIKVATFKRFLPKPRHRFHCCHESCNIKVLSAEAKASVPTRTRYAFVKLN